MSYLFVRLGKCSLFSVPNPPTNKRHILCDFSVFSKSSKQSNASGIQSCELCSLCCNLLTASQLLTAFIAYSGHTAIADSVCSPQSSGKGREPGRIGEIRMFGHLLVESSWLVLLTNIFKCNYKMNSKTPCPFHQCVFKLVFPIKIFTLITEFIADVYHTSGIQNFSCNTEKHFLFKSTPTCLRKKLQHIRTMI